MISKKRIKKELEAIEKDAKIVNKLSSSIPELVQAQSEQSGLRFLIHNVSKHLEGQRYVLKKLKDGTKQHKSR